VGRAIFLLVFFVAFIAFALIKAVGSGVQTAYNAVFNPQAQEAQAVLAAVNYRVEQFLERDQVKNLLASAIAAHGVAPDYQVRTFLDFV